MIDISKVDKIALLKDLWKNQKTAIFFAFNTLQAPSFDEKLAEKAVKGRIDYFCGRAIKTDLSKDSVDPYLYDRDAGQGTFQKVVDSILSEMENQE